jgi:glycerophosphoryl diester phosphodiesterase
MHGPAAPLVIAHRGASGYRPEHTIAGYRLAIRLGADSIEPDLVPTKDGVLVARHENELSASTDVAAHPEFADRLTTKLVDGRVVTGWFTEDFTLEEVRTLRATERLRGVRPDNTRYDGQYAVPTFDEVLALVHAESTRRGITIGICPELKHPGYFDALGLALEESLACSLQRHGLDRPGAPVHVQSFDEGCLRQLSSLVQVPLVALVKPLVRVGPAVLDRIAGYASAVGVCKDLVVGPDPDGGSGDVVDDAHRSGLRVHVWTLRDENRYLPARYRRGRDPHAKGNARDEVFALLDAGVDGLFADHPDTAVDARDEWLADRAGRTG